MSYEQDAKYTRLFLPSLKMLTGLVTTDEANDWQDQREATDLVVLATQAGLRFAARVRRPKDWRKYRDEFTIRAERPFGTSELEKIGAGWADYIIYAWGSDHPPRLREWLVGDLNVFRSWRRDWLAYRRTEPGILKPNTDGSSKFRAYRIAALPPEFVVCRTGQLAAWSKDAVT